MFMARLIAACLSVLVLLAAVPVSAQVLGLKGPSTADPRDQGYAFDDYDAIYPTEWQNIRAYCKACADPAAPYNKTMSPLLYTRFWIAYIGEEMRFRYRHDKMLRRYDKAQGKSEDENLSELEEKQAAVNLSYRMGLEDMAGKLPALREQEESLEALAVDLKEELSRCEILMCMEGPGLVVKPADARGRKMASPLPFDWSGPYDSACAGCEKPAAQLNEFPGRARAAMAGLEAARAEEMFAEMEILATRAEHDAIAFERKDDPRTPEERLGERERNEKNIEEHLEDMERRLELAEQTISKYETDLDAMARDFEEVLRLYGECAAACPEKVENAP